MRYPEWMAEHSVTWAWAPQPKHSVTGAWAPQPKRLVASAPIWFSPSRNGRGHGLSTCGIRARSALARDKGAGGTVAGGTFAGAMAARRTVVRDTVARGMKASGQVNTNAAVAPSYHRCFGAQSSAGCCARTGWSGASTQRGPRALVGAPAHKRHSTGTSRRRLGHERW
jgi:hypothetical protein